jgi:ubiquinone/menaquinone biosynthesis C-methylase UbiE
MTAAKVVGSSGHVIATDISAQMLAIAKERAMSIGMQDIIEFKESDAENIDFPDSFFDAVLCRWGLMLLPNLDTALSKIYRSIISGRRFAAAVWSAPHKVPIISLASNIIVKELQIPAPQAGIPNPFS